MTGRVLTTLILAVGQVDGQGSGREEQQKSARMGDKARPWAARLSDEETPNKFTTQLIFSRSHFL